MTLNPRALVGAQIYPRGPIGSGSDVGGCLLQYWRTTREPVRKNSSSTRKVLTACSDPGPRSALAREHL